MQSLKTVEPRVPSEWEELRGHVRHQTVEVLRLITILLQDAVILLAGFVAEFAYEHWLHSSHPFFQLAISLSSSLFLLLYGITVTVHVVQYVRGQFGTGPATLLGQYLPWALAAGGVIAAAVAVTVPSLGREGTDGATPGPIRLPFSAPERLVTRLELNTSGPSQEFALSPDGRQLVYVATVESVPRLWLRPLDQTTAQPLAGTDGASFPFWAPDGRAIGFFADGKLQRLDLAVGGTPQVLAYAPGPSGGAWNGRGVILFAPSAQRGLLRVPATGGAPTLVTRLAPGQTAIRWPQFLPDGQRFLFQASEPVGLGGIFVGSLDGGEPTRVVASDAQPLYAPPNRLLLLRQGVLIAQSFDPVRAFVSGEPQPVAQAIGRSDVGTMSSSVSGSGVLAYRSGTVGQRRQLAWMDRSGRTIGTFGPPAESGLVRPVLSPDGSRVAVTRSVQGNVDVWLMDIRQGVPGRFTVHPSNENEAVWSPDGRRVIFRSARNAGIFDLFEKPANGAGDEQLLLKTSETKMPLDMTPDGRFLLYVTQNEKTFADLWALPLDGERKPFPVVQTSFDEADGHFSPDGKWIAYESNESGQFEIYVRPFPGPGGKSQVSAGGGSQALWRRDGKELFYIRPDLQLMAVPIAINADRQTVEAGTPVALFKPRLAMVGSGATLAGGSTTPQYAVAPDGRFLVNVVVEDPSAASTPITIVLNWDAALKK